MSPFILQELERVFSYERVRVSTKLTNAEVAEYLGYLMAKGVSEIVFPGPAPRVVPSDLVLVESVWLAFLATAVGACLAWWSAPVIVRMINPPENPARLVLPADWRVLGFALALALGVTLLFGRPPPCAPRQSSRPARSRAEKIRTRGAA